MTMVQTTEHSPSGNLQCPRCDATLPSHATFCGSCGERVGKEKKESAPVQDTDHIRYQVTSLVRQRPYVKLFFALNKQQQRTVVIRDIDISSLDEEAQAKASEFVQLEYDLLRQQRIASVMPVIDVQDSQGHLLTITSQPMEASKYKQAQVDVSEGEQKLTSGGLHTLQDFLQSRKDAFDQRISLAWIVRLCRSLEGLHQHQIVIGELDPKAILIDDEHDQPWLTVSWLPPQLRQLFPRTPLGQDEQSKEADGQEMTSPSKLATSFSAPEVLLGRLEPSADVYSLGAILYFMLTGTPPDGLLQRTQQELLSPDALNARVSRDVSSIVMQALSLEPSERFQSAQELEAALSNPHNARIYSPRPSGNYTESREQLADMDTISIMPLQVSNHEARPLWETPTTNLHNFPTSNQPLQVERPIVVDGTVEAQSEEKDLPEDAEVILPSSYDTPTQEDSGREQNSLILQFTQQISGMLPAIPHLPKHITGILSSGGVQTQEEQQAQAWQMPIPSFSKSHSVTLEGSKAADETFLKHIQRMLVGERKQTMTAATIENPLRIQPEQAFNIRIRLMGRDELDVGSLPRGQTPDLSRPHSRLYGTMGGIPTTGLGSHMNGDLVYVEVRSAIHENYAYIVQQAAVKIPAQGYVAEIVIPMQPFSRKSNGRRERLHVFFFDEMRRPLYDRPFVLEILVSYLVQPGREGHHVLPIPQ